MDLLITLIWVLMLGSAVWGIVCLFKKGRRLKGLIYIFVAPILLFIALGVLTAKGQNTKLDRIAKAEGFESHSAKREAEAKIDAERKAAALKQKLKGFPDEKSLLMATDIGIKRFEAYRLLNDVDTISQYCDYSDETQKIAELKHAEIEKATDGAAENKVWEKYETIFDKHRNKINARLGLKGYELLTLSDAGYWDWHCRAAEQNWDVFTPVQAAKITFDDAKLAKENLEDFYIANLYEIKMPFVVNDNSLAVSCSIEDLEDRHYLGCYFNASGGKISHNIIYTLGKSDDDRLLLSPLNGVASGHLKDLGVKEDTRTFLQGQYRGKVYLARIADSENISAVLDLF